jgi:predicted Zn-ribbon and HTH transcriptional regulator
MAVVKLEYIRGRQQIKAHLRYITHRRGETQEKITRELFGRDGLTDKRESYQMIDMAKRGTVFYKIMISPDPMKEDAHKDLDLQHITRQTLLKLEKQLDRHFQFVATVHNDHRPHRHVHGIFLLQGRLSKEKFRALQQTAYNTATQQARLQRKALDRVREHPRFRTLNRYHAHTQSVSIQRLGRSLKPLRLQSACRSCGYGQFTGIPRYLYRCPNCHARLKQNRNQAASFELGVRT